MKYQIVLDEVNSYLIPGETGTSFKKACHEMIDYVIEFDASQAFEWMGILSHGEDAFVAS